MDSVEWHLEQINMQRLARPTDKQKVANFVMLVEKAFQYFDFRDFLAKHYGLDLEENARFGSAFARTLYDLPLQMNKFDALSSYDIGSAVEAHIASLQRARHRSSLRQHHYEDASRSDTARTPSPPKDPVSILLDRLKEEDFYAFSAPTFRAVFLSRNRVYDMDLCPKKELQKMKSSPGYRRDYVIFNEPAANWSEKGANAAIVAKKYEDACNKYRSLVLGLSKEVKAPKERRMSDEKLKREQHAKEGGKGEKGANAAIVVKKYEEVHNKYKSLALGPSKEVQAPKERKMPDKKRKIERHAKEGGKDRRVQKSLRS